MLVSVSVVAAFSVIVSDELVYNESGGKQKPSSEVLVMLINYKSIADRIKAVQAALLFMQMQV